MAEFRLVARPDSLIAARADIERQAARIAQLEELLETSEAIAFTMANRLEAIRGISYGWVDSEAIDAILESDDY